MSEAAPAGARVLWTPPDQLVADSQLARFAESVGGWESSRDGLRREDYPTADALRYARLQAWSITDVGRFWATFADWAGVDLSGARVPLAGDLEHARWFEGARVNYAGAVLAKADRTRPALVCAGEDGARYEVSWARLRSDVARLQGAFEAAGVGVGDRVAGFLPNTEHAVAACLAATGMGAVWSCCSPDFGADAVAERFTQIAPKVLLACRGYRYGGAYHDRVPVLERLVEQLQPSAKILVGEGDGVGLAGWDAYETVVAAGSTEPTIVPVAFDHPLWVLYSSGTTGAPKAIVHGHGGCLLEHLKYMRLQADVREGERFFWFTTTGWMMWNFLQAALLAGAVPVLYDGSPGYPDLGALWRLAADLPIHHFGTSAPFVHACLRKGLDFGAEAFPALRSIGSTGAPLSEAGFAWVYERVKVDVWLASMSGGTDVCTAFVGGNPWTPVRRGVIQGAALGCDLVALDERHERVVGAVGELIVRQTMPSMPVYFWGDREGRRRHASYFADVQGAWRHGDWITVDAAGGVVVHGRSDATLNRQGIRIGTAEIYRVVQAFAEVEDALIINYTTPDGRDEMPLFIKLAPGAQLDADLRGRLREALRAEASPRHVPTRVEAVDDVPYTLSGKRLEAPVKRLFSGGSLDQVANLGALRNPAALADFAARAQ